MQRSCAHSKKAALRRWTLVCVLWAYILNVGGSSHRPVQSERIEKMEYNLKLQPNASCYGLRPRGRAMLAGFMSHPQDTCSWRFWGRPITRYICVGGWWCCDVTSEGDGRKESGGALLQSIFVWHILDAAECSALVHDAVIHPKKNVIPKTSGGSWTLQCLLRARLFLLCFS